MTDRMTSPPVKHGHGPGWPLLAILVVGAALVVGGLFAFANPLGSDDDDASTRYVEAIVGAPSRVNPLFVHMNDADRDIASLVFSGLVRLDADGTPQPDLAERWDFSGDGLTVTFHLRPGVAWHTGSPFTSEDVVFTYGLLADPALQGDPEQTTLWQSIECTGPEPLTVVCTLPEPYAPFLSYATIGILPRHILQAATAASILDDPFNQAPVGTGPFRFDRMDAAHAVLRANPAYHLGAPSIDEIDLRFYPDIASATADVLRGEADGLLVDLSIDPDDYQSLRSTEGLTAHAANRSAYTSLYLNNSEAPLNDPSVRAAIAHAIDVDSIITGLLGGRGVRLDTPIAPGTWAFDSDLDPPEHDIGEARNMLDEAGWVLPDGATVRQRNNTELHISLITDQDPLRGAIADEIADQLADVGIDAGVVRQPSSDLVREYLLPRQYQAAIFGWDPGADPDPYPAWHSSQAVESGRNLAAYTSDRADEVMEEARRTNEIGKRRDLYADFQEMFLRDVPSIPLFVPLYTYFVSDEVKGIDLGVLFTPASRFGDTYDWSIERTPAIGAE